jgi:peptidoglycan/xylan/chitin deacetylase (PgdA/CDA1 family)
MRPLLLTALFTILFSAALPAQQSFPWPEGKRVALSLSFDDARQSQITNGLDLFARHKARVTFYVNPRNMTPQLEGWKRAASQGHEIGNHSDSHPCSGNFPFARANAVEDYTPARFHADLDAAATGIERALGLKSTTFAYPCGQKYIGRGANTQSTVALIAPRFLAARGFKDESANDPAFCDLSQLMGVDSDGLSFPQMLALLRDAEARGAWLVFAGHNIGSDGRQTTLIPALEELLQYANDPKNGVWLDTVHNIATYIKKHRSASR